MPKFAPIIKASADGETEILLHGPIGRSFWSDEGITGKEVTDAINATKPGTKISLVVRGQALPAEIVALPFVPNRFKR